VLVLNINNLLPHIVNWKLDSLFSHTTRAEPMLIEPLSATTNKNTYKVEVEYKMKLYRQSRQQQLNQLLWFILTGIFDDKLRPQILSVGTTTNSSLIVFISQWD
jgi:hypothetical protein